MAVARLCFDDHGRGAVRQRVLDEVGEHLLEPAVGEANDAGRPLALAAPESRAGRVFGEIADRIVSELLPPVDMSGCTSRVMAAVDAAFAAKS